MVAGPARVIHVEQEVVRLGERRLQPEHQLIAAVELAGKRGGDVVGVLLHLDGGVDAT